MTRRRTGAGPDSARSRVRLDRDRRAGRGTIPRGVAARGLRTAGLPDELRERPRHRGTGRLARGRRVADARGRGRGQRSTSCGRAGWTRSTLIAAACVERAWTSRPTHVIVPFKAGPSLAWGQPEPISGQPNPRGSERVRPLSDRHPTGYYRPKRLAGCCASWPELTGKQLTAWCSGDRGKPGTVAAATQRLSRRTADQKTHARGRAG